MSTKFPRRISIRLLSMVIKFIHLPPFQPFVHYFPNTAMFRAQRFSTTSYKMYCTFYSTLTHIHMVEGLAIVSTVSILLHIVQVLYNTDTSYYFIQFFNIVYIHMFLHVLSCMNIVLSNIRTNNSYSIVSHPIPVPKLILYMITFG